MDVVSFLLSRAQPSGTSSDTDDLKILSITVREEETVDIEDPQLGVITVIAAEEV